MEEALAPSRSSASTAALTASQPSSIDEALRALLREVVREVVREELAGLVGHALAPAPPTLSPGLPQFLNARQAGEVAGVAEKTVRGWVRAGKLRGHWAGRLLRVDRADLERFMRDGLSPSGASVDVAVLAASILRRRRKD